MTEYGRRPQTEIDLSTCYHEGGKRKFDRKAWPAGIQESLTLAHDANRGLIRERDKMQAALGQAKTRIWILSAAVAGAWALVVGLFVFILELIRN